MACLLVPVAEAAVTTTITMIIKAKQKKTGIKTDKCNQNSKTGTLKNAFLNRLNWLNSLLWGGTLLLLLEHIWHGEIVPWFPFFTALQSGEEAYKMFMEMATTGVAMSLIVTAFWVCLVLISNSMTEKAVNSDIVNEKV